MISGMWNPCRLLVMARGWHWLSMKMAFRACNSMMYPMDGKLGLSYPRLFYPRVFTGLHGPKTVSNWPSLLLEPMMHLMYGSGIYRNRYSGGRHAVRWEVSRRNLLLSLPWCVTQHSMNARSPLSSI